MSQEREIELMKTIAPATAATLRIDRVNPLDHEADLKALMTEHGIPWFGEFFDRGYRALVAEGGASWVGFDDARRIQMNLTQFAHRFQFYGASVVGSATGNVMVAQPYRTFFPAVSLFRRMLADIQARSEADFVYGDPTPGANAVIKAVKMEHVGNLYRLVLPIGDASLSKHLGARLFSLATFVLGGRRVRDVQCHTVANSHHDALNEGVGPDDRLLACHPLSLVQRRLHRFPAANDFVVELRWQRTATLWDALVLVRLAEDTRILSILSIKRRSDISLRQIIAALPSVARRLGAFRLQVETIVESKMAREFLALAFRPRGESLPLVAKAFSPLGHEAVRNVAQWEVTTLDFER